MVTAGPFGKVISEVTRRARSQKIWAREASEYKALEHSLGAARRARQIALRKREKRDGRPREARLGIVSQS